MKSLTNWLVEQKNSSHCLLKDIFRNSDLPILAGIFLISMATSVAVVIVILFNAADYGFFDVPIAAWVVLGLMGLLLFVEGLAFSLWWRLCRAKKSLTETRPEVAARSAPRLSAGEIPLVDGFRHLNRPEFLALVQTLFKAPPAVRLVQLSPLPGGHGGSATLLARLQYKESGVLLPHTFVVKLGERAEILSEDQKFHRYVLGCLGRAARFLRHARLEDTAGIAYEYAGLGLGDSVQSFAQLYHNLPANHAAALIEEIFAPLEQAWYRQGQVEPVDPRREYHLLFKKQQLIIEQVERLLDQDDPYRQRLHLSKSQTDPNLRPNFCPGGTIPWRDPVDFLQRQPALTNPIPLHRSTIHGDLNARNILFERGQSGEPVLPWFIDFSHTGNGLSAARAAEAARENIPVAADRGHTLRDFCRLEADVKFMLTTLENDSDLERAILFEQELMLGSMALLELSNPALAEAQFAQAWRVIRAIRRRAAPYLADLADLRPYYWGLLHATLPVVYYDPGQFAGKPHERRQKRYAFMAAGMLCSRL
ncbi:MAG: hypothetical protein JW953_14765 [Anaerolineae bacterium]|nr:hypothetical protein [Anaerolineae bacterium]